MTIPRKPANAKSEPEVTAPRLFRLKLVGVGGAGGNCAHQIATTCDAGRHPLAGVELIAVNTDLQALDAITGAEKLQIGAAITHGLGAGGDPEVGARAAQHDTNRLTAALGNADVVFIAAGLGGGTGTGASPVIARLAKEQGALVLAFVAMPFAFEGKLRSDQAANGLEQLKAAADAVICIHNDRLFRILGDNAPATEAFRRANDIIASGVQAIWQLLSRKGLINLDFADLRTTLGGKHCEGIFSHGEGTGPDRAREALKQLLENPLFVADETLVKAEGVLVSILGGPDLSLSDVQRTVEPITKLAPRAHIIMGAAIDEAQRDRISVTVIAATGNVARRPVTTSITAPSQRSPVNRPSANLTGSAPLTNKPASQPATAVPKENAPLKQADLPLQPMTRGRFDRDNPTLHNGEDLDIPTFLRRGISLKK